MGVKDTPILHIPKDACPHIPTCALFPLFKSKGAAGLYKVHYCHSDFKSCARHKIATEGRAIPPGLLPDGNHIGRR